MHMHDSVQQSTNTHWCMGLVVGLQNNVCCSHGHNQRSQKQLFISLIPLSFFWFTSSCRAGATFNRISPGHKLATFTLASCISWRFTRRFRYLSHQKRFCGWKCTNTDFVSVKLRSRPRWDSLQRSSDPRLLAFKRIAWRKEGNRMDVEGTVVRREGGRYELGESFLSSVSSPHQFSLTLRLEIT